MRVPRSPSARPSRFLPRAAAVAALATVLTTTGFGVAGASTRDITLDLACWETPRASSTHVRISGCVNQRPGQTEWRIVGKWCGPGHNCDTVHGNWAPSGGTSTAYHPGGKNFTDYTFNTR
ncbi:hypothetical protein ACFWYW_41345 [Nonomuraea sp. NPDC059023]|uniref:hypothetical protein n=1 Tax=unclassified Nonomuraea TaxID=2593643 RepID=UPI0036C0E8D2